ncbi:hypothetical protein B0J13DRAFT_108598 [Dactylonectria estremocensis]|uniref:Zn(2)-C6 fungal-type domain-containing protein n=1 Tax=Dactylonectria estremocensis TaxID=1079267 RepID=A0A9P9FAK7_9HYPO|nr:hypothetical protein B0J13DRAFT_108598 [Dactylonectria estremocensis]
MSEREAKRIRQACQNCRRKKTRCSGERPTCAFCARLQQACIYDDFSFSVDGERPYLSRQQHQLQTTYSHATGSASIDAGSTSSQDVALSARVAMLESQLNLLNNTGRGNLFLPMDGPQIQQSTWRTPSSLASSQSFTSLPSLTVLESLTDTYFQYCHSQPYVYFTEESFRRRLLANALPSWLLLAFVATACRFSEDPFFQGRHEEAVESYADAGWSEIHEKVFSQDDFMNVHTVQAVNMLAVIDFTAGKNQRGWVKIGLSVRFAEALNLSSEPDPALSMWLQEEHRWTFWSVYLLDRLVSCSPQHKPAIQDTDCTLDLPRQPTGSQHADGHGTRIKLASLHNRTNSAAEIDQAGHLILVASALGRVQKYSLRSAGSQYAYPPWDFRSEFASINTTLMTFESRSPLVWARIDTVLDETSLVAAENGTTAETMGILCFSHALYFTCQCILNHPFLTHRALSSQKEAVPFTFVRSTLLASRENAVKLTLLLQYLLRKRVCLTSFLGYSAVCAGVIHRLFMRDCDITIQDTSRRMYDLTLQFLLEAPVRWQNYRRMEEALSAFDPEAEATAYLVNPKSLAKLTSHPNAEEMCSLLDYSWMSDQAANTKKTSSSTAQTAPPPPPQDTRLQDWTSVSTVDSSEHHSAGHEQPFNVDIDALLAMGLDLEELSRVNSNTGGSSDWSQL